MPRNAILPILACLLLAPGLAQAETWTRIKSEAKFRSEVVNRKSVNQNGWVTVKPGGRVVGHIKGQGKIRGKWAWGNGLFCRNITIGKNALGQNCQTEHIAGSKLRYTRDQGKGQASVWIME